MRGSAPGAPGALAAASAPMPRPLSAFSPPGTLQGEVVAEDVKMNVSLCPGAEHHVAPHPRRWKEMGWLQAWQAVSYSRPHHHALAPIPRWILVSTSLLPPPSPPRLLPCFSGLSPSQLAFPVPSFVCGKFPNYTHIISVAGQPPAGLGSGGWGWGREHPLLCWEGLGLRSCQLASQQEYLADWPTDLTVDGGVWAGHSWAGLGCGSENHRQWRPEGTKEIVKSSLPPPMGGVSAQKGEVTWPRCTRQAPDGAGLEASTPSPLLSVTSMIPPPTHSVLCHMSGTPQTGQGDSWRDSDGILRWTLKGCVDVSRRRGGEHRELSVNVGKGLASSAKDTFTQQACPECRLCAKHGDTALT